MDGGGEGRERGRGGRGVGIVASLSSHSPNLCWVTISHYEFGLQPDIRNNGAGSYSRVHCKSKTCFHKTVGPGRFDFRQELICYC